MRLEIEEYFLKGGTYASWKAGKNDPNRSSLIEFGHKFLEEIDAGRHSIKPGTAKNYRATEREKDRFLLSYYFILRFSDAVRIDKHHIFTLNGQEYLRMKHQKTGIESIVPVNEKARAMLEKYDYKFRFSSNQQANRHLKTIAAMAGMTQLATEGNKTLPKCQFVCTHTARRSAATNLYLNGVSTKIIADLGGWENEQTLRLYLRASGLDTAMIAKDLDFFK